MVQLTRSNTVLVTGATGLLGSNLTQMLVERGVRVRALVRSKDKARELIGGADVELVVGDMRDVRAFSERLRGTDVVFHTAAYFRDSYKGGSHGDELYRVNVQGTRDLLRAAYANGVRSFIHTSSIAVLRGPAGAAPLDESMRRELRHAPDDYYRSKILSDAEVDAALASQPDLFACFVLPGFMNGPGDAGPTSAGQLVLDFLLDRLPGVLDVAFSYVDVRDVANALIAAAERGRRGERYIAAGTPYALKEALTLLARLTGRPAPRRVLPDWVFGTVALASEIKHRVSGKPVLASWTGFRTAMHERHNVEFDNEKTMRELNVGFRPLEDSFRDAVKWYQQHGRLPSTLTIQ